MSHRSHIVAPLSALAALLAASVPSRASGVELKYLYDLATLTGTVRLSGLQVAWDPNGNELFATGYGVVRIFNPVGVQTFSFRTDLQEYGFPVGVAALESGDLFLLTNHYKGGFGLFRGNFRGETLEPVKLRGGTPEFLRDFEPGAIAFANGKVYLADMQRMKVLLVDEGGRFAASYDLAEMIGFPQSREDLGLSGFNVDRAGNLLFTIAPMFSAYVVSLDGKVRSWGKPGGAPGKFNIVAGIAADDEGRFYVVDTLKSAVLVFDSGFGFLGEFGYRGWAPGRLIGPSSVAVGNGNVYVAQNGQRGVTVYRIAE